jgi:cell division inhibitor SepF
MGSIMSKFKNWVTGDDLEHDIYALDNEFDMEPMSGLNAHNNHGMYVSSSGNSRNMMTHDDDIMTIERPSAKRQRRNLRVVDNENAASHAHNARQAEVKVIEPESFEESLEIVEYLRANKSVVLNLHHLDTAQSQRVVDFLSGATHAIDGHQQRIGDGVFIFTPHHVNISTGEESRQADYPMAADSFWK